MLHIKDIEAFADINEALFRTSGTDAREGDLTNHPALLKPSAEVVQLVPAAERAALEDGATSVPGTGYDFDLGPARPMTMASLFSRMMFGRR
ncbi:MAG TPA: hypothetical protein VD978_08950 [Azospirillum sp.]|nr:hypothetical protein [Azospirillum sp.]